MGYNITTNAFVQTNGSVAIGGALPSSVYGGSQQEIGIAYYLTEGNWWLFVNGQFIGYYPTSIFEGGPLASYATGIDYGGEVCSTTTSFPPMGSGAYADAGYQQAAYQRQIQYYPVEGGNSAAELTSPGAEPSENYSVLVNKYDTPDWGETIWFGGPGIG